MGYNPGMRSFDLAAWIVNYGMVAAVFALTARRYPRLADPMPIHWNVLGVADGWARRAWGAWLMPVTSLVVQAVFELARRGLARGSSGADRFVWYQLLVTTYLLAVIVLMLDAAEKRNGRMTPLIWVLLVGLLAGMVAVPLLARG